MGEFNSDDRYIYYCVKNSLEEMQWLSYSTKWQNDLFFFQGKPLNITVIQVYAATTDAKEAKVDQFYEDIQHLLELTTAPLLKKM